MNFTIKNEEVAKFNESKNYDFPKYTTQIINLANQNAGATRPAKIGQLSDLFPEYEHSGYQIAIEYWRKFYVDKHPDVFDTATESIFAQIENLRNAIDLIDKKMVREWVEDLIVNKTYNGLYVQKAILAFLAEKKNTSYRLANPDEEAKGIDGFVGEIPYSVKPDTYKTMNRLPESIDIKMIYYTKKKTGLKIEVED